MESTPQNEFNLSSYLKKLKEKEEKNKHKEEKENKALNKLNAKERLLQEKRDAFHCNENDLLSFVDFYKMCSNIWSYPNTFSIPQLFIPFMIYMTPTAFDFKEALELYIPWGISTWFVLTIAVYALPIFYNFACALHLRSVYRDLPFQLNGLGKLIHRCPSLRYFRRCSIQIISNTEVIIDRTQRKELELTLLKVLAGELRRIRLHKSIFGNNSNWTIKEEQIIGFANWESASRMIHCFHHLATTGQQQIIHSVVIKFPEGKVSSEDYFEWSPEGD